ncbi:hypothetical protein VCHC65A1_02648B, partial [Vibrio cholerae HC-65A1]
HAALFRLQLQSLANPAHPTPQHPIDHSAVESARPNLAAFVVVLATSLNSRGQIRYSGVHAS